MALNKIISEGIKDSEVKLADMADGSVGINELTATGTASSSTFLRGDNAWATPTDTVVGGASGVDFNDNTKVRFGTDNDGWIYYAGASGQEVGDQSDTLHINNPDGTIHIRADKFMVISDDSAGRAIYVDDANDRLELGHDGVADAYFNGGSVEFVKDVQLNAQTDLRFADADSSNYVALQAPATIASNYTVTLPAAAPTTNGQSLTATTAGVASWSTPAAGATGGSTDKIFWENDQTVTTDYTITDNKNAGTWGPVTINSGVTVTIGDGEYWTIM